MADEYDNQCPRCDRRLVRTPGGRRCLYCGYDFSVPPEALEAGDYFTGAECGVFGLVVGLELGAAVGLTAGNGESTAVPWMAGGGALLGAVFSGWLANRVAPGVRRSFRRLLLSAWAAGILVLLLATAGLASVDAVLIIQVAATAVVYLGVSYMARVPGREGDSSSQAK